MHVRKANPADARRLAEIHVRSWQAAYRGIMPDALLDSLSIDKRHQFWTEQLADGDRHTLVVEDEGYVVGWAGVGLCRDPDSPAAAEVWGIYLDPSRYRRGIGSVLWTAVQSYFADQGHARLAVWVLEENHSARRFYEAMGGEVDRAFNKTFERQGVSLVELRYWCPTRLQKNVP